MRERRRRPAADDRWGLVNQLVVLEGRHHEQGEVYAPRDVAFEDWVAHMPAPHGQALALTLRQVAPAHDRPPGVAGKHSPTGLHLVVDIHNAKEAHEPGQDLYGPLEPARVHILAVACDVPPAREDEARPRGRIVKNGLRRSRGVLVNPPRDQHGEYPVASCDGLQDNLAVVRHPRNDCDAPLERVELPHAFLSANADHFVASIKRMLHHVLAELPRGSDDAYLHRAPPLGTSCPHGDDHVSLLVSSFDIPMSLGDLLQRIPSIDDRSQMPRLDEVFEEGDVFRFHFAYPTDRLLAAGNRGP